MKGVTDFLTKIYDRFLLLDLLSYVCPGLIVILTILFSCFPSYHFTYRLLHLELGFLQGLIIFLFSFVIGLGINQFASLIIPDVYCKGKCQNIFCSWKKKNRKIFYKRMVTFIRMDDKDLLSKRERYIIIKQMTRNNGLSLILGAIFLFKFGLAFIIGFGTLGILLFASAYTTLMNQKDFEKAVIDNWQNFS